MEKIRIKLENEESAYFISDIHLGSPNYVESRKREALLVDFLESIKEQTKVLFLLGDIFDFWFEYKDVIPKGNTRLLGKLAEFCDRGIEVHFFTGNHDMWIKDYFSTEIGMITHRQEISLQINDTSFFIGHGDGLGKGDIGYKFIKKVFSLSCCRKVFAFLHPRIGFLIACTSSKKSRQADEKKINKEKFEQVRDQSLYRFIIEHNKTQPHDYYLFAHRHRPCRLPLENTEYINTGDWLKHNSFVKFSSNKILLDRNKS